jgi:protein-S-isoprenylcysteine O-methyltransferase Ste14
MKPPSEVAAKPEDAESAPWFYRKRYLVFGLMYGFAFFAGYLITGVAGIAPVPAYRALGYPMPLASLAVALAVGGLALRVWASSYLTSEVVLSNDTTQTELRVSGPYRFTRNPLYLGNILQAVGIGLVTPWPVLVLTVAGSIAFNFALISVEEPFLSARQGAAYARYTELVPRLVPIPGKSAPSAGQRPSLADGLRAELTIGLPAVIIFAAIALTSR